MTYKPLSHPQDGVTKIRLVCTSGSLTAVAADGSREQWRWDTERKEWVVVPDGDDVATR